MILYLCMCVCVDVWMCTCVYVCMYACMHACMCEASGLLVGGAHEGVDEEHVQGLPLLC